MSVSVFIDILIIEFSIIFDICGNIIIILLLVLVLVVVIVILFTVSILERSFFVKSFVVPLFN